MLSSLRRTLCRQMAPLTFKPRSVPGPVITKSRMKKNLFRQRASSSSDVVKNDDDKLRTTSPTNQHQQLWSDVAFCSTVAFLITLLNTLKRL